MGTTNVKRIYTTGDEWLYYKVYCGERSSDHILTDIIGPLVTGLLHKNYISSWFFIRYNDPDFHLRIRFLLTDINHTGIVIQSMNTYLKQYIDDDRVYRVQTDTYIRELERYGATNIETSETLFYYQSELLLKAIELIEDDALYFLCILKAIDQLLDGFGYTLEEKLNLSNLNKEAFKNEFQADKHLTKQLDKKYRNLKDELIPFMSSDIYQTYPEIYQILSENMANCNPIIKHIQEYLSNTSEMQKDNLLSSYIHMLVNRAFRSQQRFYELVSYDFLTKYYKNLSFA